MGSVIWESNGSYDQSAGSFNSDNDAIKGKTHSALSLAPQQRLRKYRCFHQARYHSGTRIDSSP